MAPGLKHFSLFGRSKIGVSDKKKCAKTGGGGERRGERNKLCAKILAVRKSARPNFRASKKQKMPRISAGKPTETLAT